MGITDWFHLLLLQFRETTPIEWLAVSFGVSEVLLAKANKVALYPAGIAASAISIFLLFQAKLYAECTLSLYYIFVSIYGWIHWVRKTQTKTVKIDYTSRREWITVLIICIGGWFFLYEVLVNFTDSQVAGWDAAVSSTAWAGTWLLTKRKIENWIVLNCSNLIAVPLLFYKHLPLFALLTIFLFVIAIFGLINWRKIYAADFMQKMVM